MPCQDRLAEGAPDKTVEALYGWRLRLNDELERKFTDWQAFQVQL
jgi:hypothetical protein